ncbi:YqgE/AlgH family protein [Niabella ginsengisoli]|uniref:YqgE/AlgH family protein n=1 Tax=Niabella ginsengisoli TaxID=522298 RepID=A0ABS9SQP5_9BACT|nr:YqgE/AlgH family protein [Niabella ginsengisoli]MCH5600439.1 YqgE/AlgH family protein [Niabella ginsengisoli]
MDIAPGKILISSSNMDDPNFDDSIVLIAAYNDQGALGFVVNKIFDRPINELVEFSNSPAFPLYDGGPVDKEHLYFIHRRNDLITGGTQVTDNIYFGGDFKEAIQHINNKTLTISDIKIFVGYCGWDTGELESEIAEGSWVVKEQDEEIIF